MSLQRTLTPVQVIRSRVKGSILKVRPWHQLDFTTTEDRYMCRYWSNFFYRTYHIARLLEHLTRHSVGLGLGLNLSQGFHYITCPIYCYMVFCHVWIYPLSLLDSVCFISVILILLLTFTLVLQMNLNCFCHVYRRKFMNVTLTLIGCWLISFTCSDGFSLDDILHGYASLSLVRRSCYKNTGRRTDKGMWPNIQQRKAEEIRNTRNRRSVVLLNFDNKTKWVYLKCFCCFFGQVPPNWISRIIVFKRKFGRGGANEMISCW